MTTLIIILFVLIPCALLAGSLFDGKGRNYVTGFLAGLLFGPLGVLLAAVSSPDWTEVRRCGRCRALTPRRRAACHQCGATEEEAAHA